MTSGYAAQFICTFSLLGLKGADIYKRLLGCQLYRTVRETEISLIPEPLDGSDIAKMPH